MMKNKWVQSAISFGFAIGVLVGGILPLIHYALVPFVAFSAGIGSMFLVSYAQGTDGFGGKHNGK